MKACGDSRGVERRNEVGEAGNPLALDEPTEKVNLWI